MTDRCRMNPDCKGYLTLVLHCHLPYIRHSEHEDTLEERWFYEAMLETYLPLLTLLDRLDHDGVPVRLTISLTPVLLAMMEDPLMQRRFVRYLDRLIELSAKEMKRLAKAPEFRALAGMYGRRFSEFKQFYLACERDVIAQFRRHQEEGRLEILTSAATHAFLPLIKTEEAIRAQIRTAIADYERHFGRKPSGIWLPECAFTPGVDRILNECGIRFFIADTHAVQHATPHPNRGLFAPLATPYGVHAFPRDPASSEQVWSSVSGYPGDVHYREFYRDIGWDLGWNDPEEWEYIRPYVLPTGDRIHTGIKYYRITGSGLEKEPYDPRMAAERAAEHADHFLRQRLEQFREPAERLDRPPLVVSPYDAELFGHWWYEGPHFLEMLFRKLAADYPEIKAVTPSDYLAMYPESDTGKLPACSWGRNHSAEVWLQPENAWIYRHLHEAEERMICLATRARDTRGTDAGRALQHAARQLMLAQSSDWPFIIDAGTVVDYARRRVEGHLNTFRELCDQLEQGAVQSELLAELDERYPCFPKLNASDYAEVEPSSPVSVLSRLVWTQLTERTRWRRNIFMLAWEYPPKNVGGLSKSVCELSETLAELGEIVHVVTPAHYGSPYFELRNGVYIHRVPVLTSGPTDYLHWILEMNLAMTDHLSQWKEAGGRIDILHAHDWMVYDTAHELKQSFGIPFVATIHATEWGRNQGRLHTALQQRIHHLEWQLTYEAEEVFVCSSHMRDEVIRLFGLQEEKVHTVCNGILLGRTGTDQAPERDRNHPIVFFIGRLVYEKGIHTLLQAAPRILEAVPAAQFVIAGEGPLRNELQEIAVKMGLADRVTFTGFLDDAGKTYWYNRASVVVAPSLYEPFGIVALEAMRHRCPVVVSDTGGLAEIVEHGVNGFKALPNHAESLAWQVTQVLREPEQAAKMAEHAYHKLLSEYDWRVLADRVRCVYDRYTAVGAGERTGAAAAARRAANPAVYPAASADRADGGRAVVRAAMSGSKPPAASVGAAVGMNGEEIAGQAQEELVSSLVDFPGEMGVSALNDQGGAEVSDAGESMQAHEPQELSPGAFNLAWRTAWTLK